jgi:hypothetical protein
MTAGADRQSPAVYDGANHRSLIVDEAAEGLQVLRLLFAPGSISHEPLRLDVILVVGRLQERPRRPRIIWSIANTAWERRSFMTRDHHPESDRFTRRQSRTFGPRARAEDFVTSEPSTSREAHSTAAIMYMMAHGFVGSHPGTCTGTSFGDTLRDPS